ncbi:hypothetical protein [uncultured Pluralibacter sp.]|uniref:hypothetical protein n=1 Tax=uncultured Pluralibacter sp. TaxID=1490864 RepID=UPI00260D22E1|nr:hypothetical protein [uncultured Pluralibacter sp.]
MTKTHGRSPSDNRWRQSETEMAGRPSRHGQAKMGAGKKAKVNVRGFTVLAEVRAGGWCDGLRISRSFPSFLEIRAAFASFAVEN